MHYPSAIARVPNGISAVGDYIDSIRKRQWIENPVPIKSVRNFQIYLDPKDTYGVSPAIGITGLYEPEVTELFRKLLHKGMTVVDVGANIGWFTLLSASIIGTSGTVIAYEPEPDAFSLLSKSVKLNEFANVKAIQKCVADSTRSMELYLATQNLGGHSIVSQVGNSSITVNSVTLDETLSGMGINRIDIMKIDAEGAEPQVIKGCVSHLSDVRNIIMEWNGSYWATHADLLDDLLGQFELYEIVKSPFLVKKISKMSLRSLKSTNLYLRRA